MAWNAKSQAAYQGYSHLSGIEMMFSFTMWNHSLFRMCGAPRPHRVGAVFLQPFVHIEIEVLLAPEHPRQRLTHDPGRVFANPVRSDGSIELVRLTPARPDDLRKLVSERLAQRSGRLVAQAQPDGGDAPAPIVT